jgi:hypothetical protein
VLWAFCPVGAKVILEQFSYGVALRYDMLPFQGIDVMY